MKNKDFSPVSYRFFQFVDEMLHYTGIGYGSKRARRFCIWANQKKENKMDLKTYTDLVMETGKLQEQVRVIKEKHTNNEFNGAFDVMLAVGEIDRINRRLEEILAQLKTLL
ncbi:MAG: hypothetical protein WC677_07650 [Clostridia bacterium]|jgi:hypothetical protein